MLFTAPNGKRRQNVSPDSYEHIWTKKLPKFFEQGKSKGGWTDFSPVRKNENVIAKMQYPLPSLCQVWSSQHEMCCFVLL